jgi:antibiotic biosynthesis monooxygenase (ABM) superfamily enzyme
LLDRGDAALARLPQRQALIEEATPMLADGDQTEVNPVNEFWFTPLVDAGSPPPRWKQAVVTLFVILPHTLLVPLLWGPLLKLNAWLSNYVVATFLITLTIVLSVVYVCMPAATRLFAPWLAAAMAPESTPIRRAEGRIRTVSLISKELR